MTSRNLLTILKAIITEEPFMKTFFQKTIEHINWISGSDDNPGRFLNLPLDIQRDCWNRAQEDINVSGLINIWKENPDSKSLKIWMELKN